MRNASTLSMVVLRRCALLNANGANRECFVMSANGSRNKFVACLACLIFGTAGFAERSNYPAFVFNHCLAAERVMQLGN